MRFGNALAPLLALQIRQPNIEVVGYDVNNVRDTYMPY
jgi:hypothetical protein